MLWREGEGATRKPQEQAAQLKGVFGEGASMLAVPQSARTDEREQPERGQEPPLTPEQFQRKAQSRGLWDGGANKPPSQLAQPRAGTLPRAVVGTTSSGAANTNFKNPSIGNEASPPLPAALAAAQPMAAGEASPEASAALAGAEARGREPRVEADPDVMDTMELDMAKFIQKGGLPQKAPAQAAPPATAAQPARPVAAPAAQAQAPQAARKPAPAAAAQAAPATPPTVAAGSAMAQKEAAAKVAISTQKLATRPTPSRTNTVLLLALIVIAALVAVLFIGAALGIWRLPWSAASSTAGHASLSKSIPAKSLPEMRTPAVPAQQQVIPTAIAAQAAPAEEPHAQPTEPAAPSADPEATPVPVMAAEEAAPMHAAASSGGDPEDDGDHAPTDVTELLNTARAELRAGQIREAEALLRPALEQNPNDHHVAELLAQALIARGAAVEAVALAQRIVKKRPKRASYRVLLGDALRRAGDEPGAKAAYREALALDPNLRDAHRRLSKMN